MIYTRKKIQGFALLIAILVQVITLQEVQSQNKGQESLYIKKEVALQLLPGPDNRRNSEGAFITLKNGKILHVYTHFTGNTVDDHEGAYLASRYSTDRGKNWSTEDATVVSQEGLQNVMSVSLLRLQNGAIALFYLRKNSDEDCIPMLRFSYDEAKTWTEPIVCIKDRKGYFVLNNDRVIQLKNGRLLMPVALHKLAGEEKWSSKGRLFCYYSDDQGRTWIAGDQILNPKDILTQEPGVVELKNGNIFMFIRTNQGVQYASYSSDQGASWTEIEPTEIASPTSPALIKRVPSTGDLLLVWNNNGKTQQRTPLNTAISKDEGKTWQDIKIMEDDPKSNFCYPTIHFVGKHVLIGYFNFVSKNIVMTVARVKVKELYR